jgi:LacI family transcriptional regulator
VADRAGVAVSTVSRVLNGGYASVAAKGRVHKAVRELGYTPSVTARSLVTGQTGSIGVVAHSSQSPWFSQLLGGIEEQLAHSRRSVLLASLMQKGRYDLSAVSAWVQEHRVDGLIFVRYTRRERPLFKAASQSGLPVVLLAPDITAPAGTLVRCNNVEGGRLVASHLARFGHRKIAFAGGPRESIDSRDRLKGLRLELAERHVAFDPQAAWFGPSYNPEAGIEYAERFLGLPGPRRPTAVVLGNDAMALGFMRTVLQRGVRIPREVSVVGFDGIPDGALYWPGLTTVSQPTYLMGAAACRALLSRIHDSNEEAATALQFGVELIVRESTARAPRGFKTTR